jgi:hypothetical protein
MAASSAFQERAWGAACMSLASDHVRWPVKCDVSSPRRATWRLTTRIDPAEVTHSPSSRMTPRQDLEEATAWMSWSSDQLRSG